MEIPQGRADRLMLPGLPAKVGKWGQRLVTARSWLELSLGRGR